MAIPLTSPIHIAVNASSSGDNTLVALVAGKQIIVREYCLVPAGSVSIKFKSSAATDLMGAVPLGASNVPPGLAAGNNGSDRFTTNVGEALILNLSGAVAVTGWLKYVTL